MAPVSQNQLTEQERDLILTALGAMSLRHNEWYKLEATKRNCCHERLQYHVTMETRYKNLREKLLADYLNSTTT